MFMTLSEISKRYHISKTAIRNFVRSGKFPEPKRIGGCVRWSEEELKTFEENL